MSVAEKDDDRSHLEHKRLCITAIAAINGKVGIRYYYIFVGSNNKERFIRFLTRLCRILGGQDSVLICDNLSIHKLQEVKSFFNK